MKKKRLGDLLCHAGVITAADLEKAIATQTHTGKRMGETLVDLKMVTEFDIANVLASQLGIEYVTLETTPIEPDAISAVPEGLAQKYLCIPINLDKRHLSVAMADPLDYECIKDIGFHTNFEVKPLISTREEILNAIQQHYNLGDSVENIIHSKDSRFKDSRIEILPTVSHTPTVASEELKKKSQMAPIVKLFNLIFMKAVSSRASDIHIDALRKSLSVRFRVDGILREEMKLPKWVQGALVSRIKVLATLDISERRLPQDGAIRVKLDNRDIDLRISTLPTHYGEKVVIRILDQSNAPSSLEGLGLTGKELKDLEALSVKKQGILLVTGPTGSGKTSTLYAIINKIRSAKINIMTVEDPIEYDIEGLNQIQVKPEIGLTFANCLRSILRQDPNVILIGEIRDLETAEIAVRAAMTGHFVISTVHTNDSVSTIVRLMEMGLPRYILSTAMVGIVAQRLVRKICMKCRVEVPVDAERIKKLGSHFDPASISRSYQGKGCQWCKFTGFHDRIGIFEILPMASKVKEVISSGGTEEEVRRAAELQGMETLAEEGFSKVNAGLTTLEEVLRVIALEDDIKTPCPRCGKVIHLDFIACPHCKYDVQSCCPSCKRRLQDEWLVCPYCRHDVSS
ncbi:MAG: ATPase, T2SS/T4P/T4SS family [Nitrospiria bacterium]